MKTMKNNNILSPRLSLIPLFLVLGVFTGILSCDNLDDTPPPSAYVPPIPEPEPGPGEPCKFETIVPELANGVDFECGAPEITFFGEKEGSFTLEFVENPDASGINTSKKVVEYTQTAGVEPWAGFFFELASTVDFSVLQTIKIKVYSPAADQIVTLKLEDKTDASIAKQVEVSTTVANQWEELAFTFSSSDSDKFDKLVLFFDFNGKKDATTVHYFDDIVMVAGGTPEEPTDPSVPKVAAPTPTVDLLGVISIFSDAFTNVADTDFNPNWGQSTQVTQELVGDNNTLKYASLNYQGTTFASAIDVSAMTMVHVDYWTSDSSSLNLSLVSTGTPPKETPYVFTLVTGQWVSVDIPLSEFSSVVDLSDVFQLKFDGNGTIYLDNIYFHAPPATEPTVAATVPSHAAADVISLFSDAYTNVAVDTWRTVWSEATLEDMTIADNAVKKYSELDYVGIETVVSQIDATDMTHFHTDIWTSNATQIRIKLVDFGADGAFGGGDDVEHEITIDNPAQYSWLSLNIPLSDFTGLTSRANIAQLIYSGEPTGTMTLFVDNVYFHK